MDPEALGIPIDRFPWWSTRTGKMAVALVAVSSSALAVALATRPAKRVQPQPRTQTQTQVTATAPMQPTAAPPALAPAPETAASAEAIPALQETASQDEEIAEDLKTRGLAYVTVHSTNPLASVFVMFTRYGPVEHKLLLPCGRRFIGVGIPARDRKEPTWLAPGKAVEVPCGGAIEMTMNQHRVK